MGGKSKAPSAPSPQAQSSAQIKTDKETSYYNALLQNMDQFTPYGNLTYESIGTKAEPKWTSTISLSPEQQQIFESQNRQNIALNNLGEQQIGKISESISNPFSFGGLQNQLPTAESINEQQLRGEEALMARLNPQFAQDEEALRTRLINQGIGQGSQAYQREMDTFNQARNDARTQAILGGQQFGSNAQQQALQRRLQEIDEYNVQRNAPLNEYIGLTSGTQIVNPQFQSGGNQGINSFDIAGAMRNDYSNRAAQYNNQQSATSSLFGLGGQAVGTAVGGPVGGFVGGAIGSLFSDINLKENIKKVGKENGFKVYKFNYKAIPEKTYIGVMAQDVEKIMPEAVNDYKGFKMVNYNMIGIDMREIV